jgi:hypothetical protein
MSWSRDLPGFSAMMLSTLAVAFYMTKVSFIRWGRLDESLTSFLVALRKLLQQKESVPSLTEIHIQSKCIPLKLLDYASLILKTIDAIDNRLRFGVNVGVRRRSFRDRDIGRNLVLGALLLRGLGLGLCREVVVDGGRHGDCVRVWRSVVCSLVRLMRCCSQVLGQPDVGLSAWKGGGVWVVEEV